MPPAAKSATAKVPNKVPPAFWKEVTLVVARLEVPEIPKVAPEILLVTDNESKIAADDTERDCPIPTLPATFKEAPMPRKLLK